MRDRLRALGAVPLCAAFALCVLPLSGCQTREVGTKSAGRLIFSDDFERSELGPAWRRGIGERGPGTWRIEEGELVGDRLRNDPLWWTGDLPDDVRIELDARSPTPAGDLKIELFGNKRDHASGYIVIFGGWQNTLDVIARLDEHGADRKERPSRGVGLDRTHRFVVERRGSTIRWSIDGEEVMRYDDPEPLRGPGREGFALSNWEAPVHFDNVRIYALGQRG